MVRHTSRREAVSAPRHVLVIDHTGREGGAELSLLRIVERLPAGVGVDAVLFEEGGFVDRLRAVGTRVLVLPLDVGVNTASRETLATPLALMRSASRMVTYVPRLSRAIRASGADLVVANSLKSAAFVAFAAPLAGRRWVWHLHDRLAADYLPGPLRVAMRLMAVVGPRRIVANSYATLSTLPRAARSKTSVAYPGLDAPSLDAATDTGPRDAPASRTVGIIGRISPTKGQHEFLRAAAIVGRIHPDVRFCIVGAPLFGEDDYAAQTVALAAELDIADRVEFTGWLADPRSAMRAMTVVVHASPVPEPFGQVVVEAMAAGIPVVATDAGGVREILAPNGGGGNLGELVPVGDEAAIAAGITRILDDLEAALQRAETARAVVRDRFTIDATVDAVLRSWTSALRY